MDRTVMGYDVGRPQGAHWYDRFGYTPGQRVAGIVARLAGGFLGGPVGSKLAGAAANGWANSHTPNPADGGYSGNQYGSFITGGNGMTNDPMNWGGQSPGGMPGQDMFGGYGNGSMFDQGGGPFSVPGQDPATPSDNPFVPQTPVAPQAPQGGGYGLGSSGGFMGGHNIGPRYGSGATFGNSNFGGMGTWAGSAGTRGLGTSANYSSNGAMYGQNSGGMNGGIPVHMLGGFKMAV